MRLLGKIKEYTANPDAQFRNYCERGVGMLKKYLRMACNVEKTESLPILIRSELEFMLESAASTLRNRNG